MGDGQPPQRITRPADYDPATEDRTPRRPGPATTTTAPAVHARRRRDVDAPADFRQPFVVTYQYRTQGSYKYVQQRASFAEVSKRFIYSSKISEQSQDALG